MSDMVRNLNAYWETDDEELMALMLQRFKNSTAIPIMRTTFLQSFIDNMSSLYSNTFTRVSNYPKDVEQVLNYCMQENERYLHLSREIGMYFENNNTFKPLDASQYLVDDSNAEFPRVYLTNELDGSVLLFIKNDGIYSIPNTTCVGIANTTYRNVPIEVIRQKYKKIQDIKELPFVFMRYPKLSKPTLNPIVTMQYNYIISMSWGYYNIDPKLLTQFTVNSDLEADKVRDTIGSLGRTTKVLKFGVNDKLGVIDTGDLKALLDANIAYDTLIKQRALQYGVDKSVVDLSGTGANASGDAKKIERFYINQRRKKFMREFELFEKRVCEQYNAVFGTSFVVESVSFDDLPLDPNAPVANTTTNVSETQPQEETTQIQQ
jgi:hypothetical protein